MLSSSTSTTSTRISIHAHTHTLTPPQTPAKKTNNNTTTTIHHLPNEILEYIFIIIHDPSSTTSSSSSYSPASDSSTTSTSSTFTSPFLYDSSTYKSQLRDLYNITKTCRRFYNLAIPLLYKDIIITSPQQYDTFIQNAILSLKSDGLGSFIKSLRFQYTVSPESKITNYIHEISKLFVDNSTPFPLTSLEKLIFRDMHFAAESAQEKQVATKFFHNLQPTLKHIQFFNMFGVSRYIFDCIAEHCRGLESMSLRSIHNYIYADSEYRIADSLLSIATNCHHLRLIECSNVEGIKNPFLNQLTLTAPPLQIFDFDNYVGSYYSPIHDENFIAFIDALASTLAEISITYCKDISGKFFERLAFPVNKRYLEDVGEVYWFDVNEDIQASVCAKRRRKGNHTLRKLKISDTPNGCSISSLLNYLEYYKTLEILEIYDIGIRDQADIEEIYSIGKYCPSLRVLIISGAIADSPSLQFGDIQQDLSREIMRRYPYLGVGLNIVSVEA